MMKKISLLLIAAFAVHAAVAQTTRTVQDLQLNLGLQGELALRNGDYLLFALSGQHDPGNAYYNSRDRPLGFDEQTLLVGYEHFWSDHWSGGATLRYLRTDYSLYVTSPVALLRHRAQLGPLTFGQRLSAECFFSNGVIGSQGNGAGGEVWVRLRADLEKQFPLGHLSLRPRLSYEAATHFRPQRSTTDADERTIQFTSLRGEIGLRISSLFDFTPWVAYQTSYFTTVPQYNSMGQQVSGSRLNTVVPVVGVDVRFTLFQGSKAFERRQLPTQH